MIHKSQEIFCTNYRKHLLADLYLVPRAKTLQWRLIRKAHIDLLVNNARNVFTINSVNWHTNENVFFPVLYSQELQLHDVIISKIHATLHNTSRQPLQIYVQIQTSVFRRQRKQQTGKHYRLQDINVCFRETIDAHMSISTPANYRFVSKRYVRRVNKH